MAPIGCRMCFPLARGNYPRWRAALAIPLMLGLGLGLVAPGRCDAAKLSSFLTSKDLARPLLLDQNGQQLQLPSSHHSHPVFPRGSTPTYLAVPLSGGEHLPAEPPRSLQGRGAPPLVRSTSTASSRLSLIQRSSRRDWPWSTHPTAVTSSNFCRVFAILSLAQAPAWP